MLPPEGTNNPHLRSTQPGGDVSVLDEETHVDTSPADAVPAAPSSAAPEDGGAELAAAFDPGSFERQFAPGRFAVESDDVSTRLYKRLGTATVAAVRRRIEDNPALSPSFSASIDPRHARYLLLHYGVWLGDRELLARTGLRPAEPPPEVHTMTRGPTAAAGGLYEADLVANALASAGVEIASVRAALDFGCSSGRVLRVLAAAYPKCRWIGCDPNAAAVAWAQAEMPGIEWFENGSEPPLPFAPRRLDLVYAISVWSHFEPRFGLRWFEEMRRLLRPGGHLVFTAHGLTSLAVDARNGWRPPAECDEIKRSLYRDGRWFIDCFGTAGDWGVINPSWGSAFFTPEFVLEQLCPRWRLLDFAAGRNLWHQDVYVLERAHDRHDHGRGPLHRRLARRVLRRGR
jgi:SAM-dependent methyltransferase